MTSQASQSLPWWLIALLVIQLPVAVLFGLFGWSQTVSLAQGRPASALDIAALSLPAALVIVLGAAAIRFGQAGRRDLAGICAILPVPVAIAAFMLLGAV